MMQIVESDLLGVRRVVDVPPDDAITIVAYGGGVNSTALLCGWIERGLRPVDLVVFSARGLQNTRTVQGLGRRFSWRDLIHGKPMPLFTETQLPCECYD